MENTPETPGKDMVFTKPNIPQSWTPAPVYIVTEAEGQGGN